MRRPIHHGRSTMRQQHEAPLRRYDAIASVDKNQNSPLSANPSDLRVCQGNSIYLVTSGAGWPGSRIATISVSVQ
jgi:hypothetical protein